MRSKNMIFTRPPSEAIDLIKKRQPAVGVIGLGRIGLPLAATIARAGFRVTGVDINEKLVDQINSKQCPYTDEIGLSEALIACEGRLRASIRLTELQACDFIIISLPTLVSGDTSPDIGTLLTVSKQLGELLVKGQVLVLQSTVPLDTSSHILELLQVNGLVGGRDFGLAYSPERVQSPQVLRDLETYPKVVAGFDAHSTLIASEVFRSFAPQIIEMSSPTAAELEKLVENSFRDLTISFANQVSQICQLYQLDVSEVLQAANSQPYCQIPNPGLVGGHCVPYAPHFLYWSAKKKGFDANITRSAREFNESMFTYVKSWIEGECITLYGLAFKPNVRSFEYSHTWKLLRMLESDKVIVHDPFLNLDTYSGLLVEMDPYKAAKDADSLVFCTAHDEYKHLDLKRLRRVMRGNLLVDVRGLFNPEDAKEAGFRFRGLGRYAQD